MLSIYDEALELFDDNLEAMALATYKFQKEYTYNKILNNFKNNKWKFHEKPLQIAIDTLTIKEVRVIIELSQADFEKCKLSLLSSAEVLRLNNFKIDRREGLNQLRYLDDIIVLAKEVHNLISRLLNKKSKFKIKIEKSLFDEL